MAQRLRSAPGGGLDDPDSNSQLETIQAEFEGLKQAASRRQEQLAATAKHAQQFYENVDKMEMWLRMNEEKLDYMGTPVLTKEGIAKQLKEAQVNKKFVWNLMIEGVAECLKVPAQQELYILGIKLQPSQP